MSARNAEGLLAFASRLARNPSPPPRDEMARFIDAAAETLASESAELRPRDSSGRPGGLVLLPDLPTVLLPDIHARPDFIYAALRWEPPWMGAPLANLLEEGKANLVCLGDILHSEGPAGMRRWTAAYEEYRSGWASHPLMDEEMGLALAAARAVIAAKATFPTRFHWIKGNHDNVADEDGRGDHSFYKFAAEGAMTASWFAAAYGDDLVDGYRSVETALPVLALGRLFAASHAEPAFALSREDVIEYRSRPDVVEALIWTANGDAEEGSVAESLDRLLGPAGSSALWFGGHRPVSGRYSLRSGGRYVQFHEVGAQRAVFIPPGRAPDPERDIVDIA
jgi:hypothetical protein